MKFSHNEEYLAFVLSMVTSIAGFENINQLTATKTKPPPSKDGEPLDVRLGIHVESLGNFRSTDMTFDTDLYVYMSWIDTRLKHRKQDYVMVNDDSTRKRMWLPDLYFANARHAQLQTVTRPNFNLFIDQNGQIAYSLRCTLTVACSLDLRFYPMDQQVCAIKVLSYAHIAKQLNVTWFSENPLSLNPAIGLPEFSITNLQDDYCNGTYRYALMPNAHKTDNFSCLSAKLYLQRSLGYNLLQSYIPTGLIVMISWVSFWIDRRAVPARVTLSFTTLVSFTTLGSGLRFGLAQVSYAKALDFWYGMCLLFVFLALLEFAIINSFMRKSEKNDSVARKIHEDCKRKQRAELLRRTSAFTGKPENGVVFRRPQSDEFIGNEESLCDSRLLSAVGNGSDPEFNEDSIQYFGQLAKQYSRKALALDKQCRVWFPIFFLLFNIIYWWFYLVHKKTGAPVRIGLVES